MYGIASRGSGLIGLDIGTTSVKAARIRRRGDRVTVTGLARAAIEPADKEASSPDDKVVLAIWRCLRHFSGARGVVCSLSGADVAVRPFDFPPLPRHQLPSAVELEAAQVCPFEVGEAAVAHHVLQGMPPRRGKLPEGRRIVGFFAAAKNTIIQQRRALCERGNTTCILMDVDGLALLNCLEACKRRKAGEAVLALNVGHSWTNLTILSDDGVPFVRDIPYAGDHIVTRIARILESPREAVAAALEGGRDGGISRHKLQSALHQACSGLTDRVIETIRYYGARQSGPAVDRVFLCGGFNESGPAARTLIELLPGKVELWDPLTVLSCTRAVRKNRVVEHGPAFAVAIGLALRTLRDVHD